METIDWAWLWPIFKAIIVFTVGFVIAKIASNAAEKVSMKHVSPQQSMLLKKVVFFGILFLFLISALQQLNFKLSVLLGSAGIATAAIGFASKTSISNMISGIFLIIERSFKVGDTIRIKGLTGVVKSIDLLSVKLTTFDHTLVRIPNEMIISNEVVNLTHYAYRRLDISVGVAYKENIGRIKETLLGLAKNHTLALKKPEPSVRITAFADSSITMCLSVYVKKNHYATLNVELHDLIKATFDQQSIDIPFPQMTIHTEESK